MQSNSKIYNLQSFIDLGLKGKNIGILGGSFNPPHIGHLAIAQHAIKIGLDYVVLMITEQNPLKPTYTYSLNDRAKMAVELIRDNERIIVSTLESDIHSPNTYYTLEYLNTHFSDNKFIWIMGVDCLAEFHLWENYDKFKNIVDIVIFNRPGYINLLSDSISAKVLKPRTCEKYESGIIFVEEELSSLSSTEIRKQGYI
jgi:nicotinate-nucleotide adenylyltransferase